MTINNNNFFELSARRDEETGNLIKESIFGDTETIEETSQDGSYYSKEDTTVKGSGFISNFFEKSSKDGLEEEQSLTERALSIGVPDIIENQDQILEEIHKIDGFENVTIDDVLNGTTGLSEDQLFNIMFNSDASIATGKKKDSGTDGYGKGEVEPTQFVMGSDKLVTKTKENFSENDLVKSDNQESNIMKSIAASINQNTDRVKVRNVIQPMINEVQVPTPVPQPFPVTKTNTQIIPIDVSRGQNSLAKSIT